MRTWMSKILVLGTIFVPCSISTANAADGTNSENRFKIISIQRNVTEGNENRVVNGTMMVDEKTGQNWILDEKNGRWVPVGFRKPKMSGDVSLLPTQ